VLTVGQLTQITVARAFLLQVQAGRVFVGAQPGPNMAASFSFLHWGGRLARRSASTVDWQAEDRRRRRQRGILRCVAVVVLAIAILGVWMSAGFAHEDDSTRAARSAMVKSLEEIKGRFHRVHGMTLKLQCGTCHASDRLDALVEGGTARNRPAAVAREVRGPVDRTVCLGCHRTSARPAWADK